MNLLYLGIGLIIVAFILKWLLRKRYNPSHLDVKRRPFSFDEKAAVVEKTVLKYGKSQCWHCGKTEDLAVDHITPLNSGGGNWLDNLQILCKTCNSSKRDRYEG